MQHDGKPNAPVEIHRSGVYPQELLDGLDRTLPEEFRGQVSLSVEQVARTENQNGGSETVGGSIRGGTRALAALVTALLNRGLLSQQPESNGPSVLVMPSDGNQYKLSADASSEQINQVVAAVGNAQEVRMNILK